MNGINELPVAAEESEFLSYLEANDGGPESHTGGDDWIENQQSPESFILAARKFGRSGLRMSCLKCEVAWTGPATSRCWVDDSHPGLMGPPPSVFPTLD